MKTKHKIALAKAAYQTINACRRIVGGGDDVIVTRRGIRYHLDLSEGIDLAIYLQGQFEPATALACSRYVRPGQIVLDIGANVGAHTLSLARLVGYRGRVLAFEPTAYAYGKLKQNLALNPELARRVEPFQCFLGPTDDAGLPDATYSSWPLKGGERLHSGHLGQPMSTEGARMLSLDGVLAESAVAKVDFIKLDVDGHENGVLAGARETLRRDRPILLMEFAPYVLTEQGVSPLDLLAQLVPLGYRFHRETDDSLLTESPDELVKSVPVGACINMVARCREAA
jgi:FkbM family methyltransferase